MPSGQPTGLFQPLAKLNSIIDNIAVMIAGMVVANFLLAVKDSVMASGE